MLANVSSGGELPMTGLDLHFFIYLGILLIVLGTCVLYGKRQNKKGL